MDKLNFKEFPQQNSIDWRKQIEKDLKMDLEKLQSKIEDLSIEPFYHDPERESSYNFVKQNPDWSILTYLNSNDQNKIIDLIKDANNHENYDFYFVSELVNNKLIGLNDISFLLSNNFTIKSLQFKSSVLALKHIQIILPKIKKLSIDFNPFEWQTFQSINQNFILSEWESLAKLTLDQPHLFSESHIFRVSTANLQESGAHASEQIACAASMAIEIIEEAQKYKISLPLILNNISFEFAIGTDFFLEIAKLRAFRIVWNSILQSYNSDLSESPITCISSSLYFSKTEVQNNLLRLTSEAMSAVLGTCDYLTLLPYSYKNISDNSEQTRLSRNVQHLLKSESYLDKISDAAYGSYSIESQTNQLAQKSLDKFKAIENEKGFLVYLKSGKLKSSCDFNKKSILLDLQNSNKKWITVNAFKDKSEAKKIIPEKENIVNVDKNYETYFSLIQDSFLLNKIDLEDEFNKMEESK